MKWQAVIVGLGWLHKVTGLDDLDSPGLYTGTGFINLESPGELGQHTSRQKQTYANLH